MNDIDTLDRLEQALDGAKCVTINEDIFLVVVWYGGATFNVYSLPTWKAFDHFTQYGNDTTGEYIDWQEARVASIEWIREQMSEEQD